MVGMPQAKLTNWPSFFLTNRKQTGWEEGYLSKHNALRSSSSKAGRLRE